MSVRIKLQNKDYLLKPGMFTNVKVTCKASEERMARIDPHSLVFENGKNYVVAVDGDGSLQVKRWRFTSGRIRNAISVPVYRRR